MNFWAHLKFPGMNFSTTPSAVTGGGSGGGSDAGGGAGGGTGGTPTGTTSGPGGNTGGQSTSSGAAGSPSESPNVRQLREQYEAVKSKYEPWEKLGVQPQQVQQYQAGYQQVYNEVRSVANNLGYEESDVAAAIEQHGLVATLDFLRNEAYEQEQAQAGDQDIQFQRELDQRIQQGIEKGLTPIQQRENARQTNEANALYERTVHGLIAQDCKALGIDVGSLSPDEMSLLVAGTSEVMQYSPADIKALKFDGQTSGVQKAYQTFKTMLDKYYIARSSREMGRTGVQTRGVRPQGQGRQQDSQSRPTLDDLIDDPSKINAKYA